MRSVEVAGVGFALSGSLDPAVLDELRLRHLPAPAWDARERAWRFAAGPADVQALRFLTDTHQVRASGEALARLVELELQHHAPSHRERVAALEAKLRPYQLEGVERILRDRRVLLADSMGLGKSLQALVAIEKAAAYPAVIVCPMAVKLGWQREVLKWVPWRSEQVVVRGRDRLRAADITVLNPELLAPHVDDLLAARPQAVVLDEAHFFKNPGAQRSQLALRLSEGAPLRLALTGTPIKNRREDLEHQLRILGQLEPVLSVYRGLLPHWWKPGKEPLSSHHAVDVLSRLDRKTLNERLRDVCMVRRTKLEVAKDLPPLGRTRVDVQAPRTQAYRDEETAMLDWVRKWHDRFGADALAHEEASRGQGVRAAWPEAFQAHDKATRRLGAAGASGRRHDELAPEALDADEAGAAAPSPRARSVLEFRAHLSRLRREAALAKLPFAREWVQPLLGSGERVVFFAYHKLVVERLAETLRAMPARVATITGDTPAPARRAILDALDQVDFLVATMDATGYGVDGIQLHASHVAFVELDWTPTKHEQCEGRLHRIGQSDPVNAWYLVATNTIDDDMMRVLEHKWADIQGIVDGREDEEDTEFLDELLGRLVRERAWEPSA